MWTNGYSEKATLHHAHLSPAGLALKHTITSAPMLSHAHNELRVLFPTLGESAISVLLHKLLPLHPSISAAADDDAFLSSCERILLWLRQQYLDGQGFEDDPSYKIGHICVPGLPASLVLKAAAQVARCHLHELTPMHTKARRDKVLHAWWCDTKPDVYTHAKIGPPPEALRAFMAAANASVNHNDLVQDALRHLHAACALALPGSRTAKELQVSISEDIDFGTVTLFDPAVDATTRVVDAMEESSPLDVLMAIVSPLESDAAPRSTGGSSLLRIANVIIRNAAPQASDTQLWLLGGIAAPTYASTFMAVDAVGEFFQRHQRKQSPSNERSMEAAVCLKPQEQHVVSVAVSCLDSAARKASGEIGILQQVLLFFIAAPRGTALHTHGAHLDSVVWHDVAGGQFRVFVVARRVSTALVRGDVSNAKLDFEAKPFVPETLRHLFQSPPATIFARFAVPAVEEMLSAETGTLHWSAATKSSLTTHLELSNCEIPKTSALTSAAMARTLQQHLRLLLLEEQVMEASITKYDLFNVRLNFAIFTDSLRPRQYVLWKQPPGPSKALALYRGPLLHQQLPHYLLVIQVPGLPEGKPAVSIGGCVHVRFASQPAVEFVTLVLSTQGTSMFLLPPAGFPAGLSMTDHRYSISFHQDRFQNEVVHVRFSLDRKPFVSMRASLSGSVALAPVTALVPPMISLPPSPSPSTSMPVHTYQGSVEEDHVQAYLKKAATLQPKLTEVALEMGRLTTVELEWQGGIALNAEQRGAVASVLCGSGRAAPFALWGPPGTGKTVTLVTIILQLRKRYPKSGILACAPANYSADLLCSALAAAGVTPSEMLRLNDPRRPPYEVKQDVLPFCVLNDRTGAFTPLLPQDDIPHHIVVCSCICAGILAEQGRTFNYVLIDEGGQALLAEALIPLCTLRPPASDALVGVDGVSSNVWQPGWGSVVCGDPKQLGPTVHSFDAAKAGLGSSLLEHLIQAHSAHADQLTTRHGVSSLMCTLKANYRSHAALLDLPSKLFYQDQLRVAADQTKVQPPTWHELRNNGADLHGGETREGVTSGGSPPPPQKDDLTKDTSGIEDDDEKSAEAMDLPSSLLFYGVRGEQAREGDAPSYFNMAEAQATTDLIQGLVGSNSGVAAEDIGVMATYRRQVQALRMLLRGVGLGAVRVGTVDDLQGQEMRCIFISTVRSKPQALSLETDSKHSLWGSPRRFNVAITRAKALLVVVGHPTVLLEDELWRELLRYALHRGVFRGAGADAIRRRLGAFPGLSGRHYSDPYAVTLQRVEQGNNDDNVEGVEDARDGGDLGIGNEKLCLKNSGGFGVDTQSPDELERTIEQLAELALLGSGTSRLVWPDLDDLEEMNEVLEEEVQWRVML